MKRQPDQGADWRSDADRRIERIRKGDFTIELRGADGRPVTGAQVTYRLKRHSFLFGTAIAHGPFVDQSEIGRLYRQFILEHFSGLVCENEMKWHNTEVERGREDYAQADALLAFAEQNGLAMRGHCLCWEKDEWAQPWLAALGPDQLRAALAEAATAVALAPDAMQPQMALGDVLTEMKRGAEARPAYEKALSIARTTEPSAQEGTIPYVQRKLGMK